VACTYASFEEEDVLKFGFDIFDEDGSGAIDEYEMARMVGLTDQRVVASTEIASP
jgi:Ca2+-binding EF-hand superfamily protein